MKNKDKAFEDNVLDDSDLLLKQRFSHSFRHSAKNLTAEFKTAETYLKNVINTNIKISDLRDFYYDDYEGEGIVNAYLRILDVYNEMTEAKMEHFNPGQKFNKIKIFDTSFHEEFQKELDSGVKSSDLEEELSDIFDYNLMLIPISHYGGTFLFIVDITESVPNVILYGCKYDEEFLQEMSELILNLLHRAYETHRENFDEEEVTGSNHTVKNISEILQVAEGYILDLSEEANDISDTQLRHKIVDRIVAISQL